MATRYVRAIQLDFPLASPPRATMRRAGRRWARRGRPLPPRPRACPDCRGPIAVGEGRAVCVVCGQSHAA